MTFLLSDLSPRQTHGYTKNTTATLRQNAVAAFRNNIEKPAFETSSKLKDGPSKIKQQIPLKTAQTYQLALPILTMYGGEVIE